MHPEGETAPSHKYFRRSSSGNSSRFDVWASIAQKFGATAAFRLLADSGVQMNLTSAFGPGVERWYGFLSELGVHAPYYALFTVGPITNLIEIWFLPAEARLR